MDKAGAIKLGARALALAMFVVLALGGPAHAQQRSDRGEARRSERSVRHERPRQEQAGSGGASATANSGSVKTAGEGAGIEPDNDPKPGCTLRVDFYGFRAGDFDLTLTAIPPTGGGVLLTDDVTIPTTSHGSSFQTSRTYELLARLTGIAPAHQGFHVKLSVKRVGSHGNGAKHKVFWLRCDQTSTVTDTTPRTRLRTLDAPVLDTSTTSIVRKTVKSASSLPPLLVPTTEVFDNRITIAGSTPRSLASTGVVVLDILKWAILMCAVGFAATRASRAVGPRAR